MINITNNYVNNKYLVPDRIKFSSFLLLVFIVSLISCTTYSFLELEVLTPAKKEFPQHLKKLIVVDRTSFDYTNYNTKSKFFIENEDQKYLKILDSITTDYFIGSLIENINNEPRFILFKPIKSLIIRKNKGSVIQKLDWNEIADIIRQDSADGVLALESCFYTDNYKISNNPDGTFAAIIEIIVISEWNIYDGSQQNSYQISCIDTSIVDIFGYTKNDLIANVPNPINIYQECGLNSGIALLQIISPYWIPAERFYFTGPGPLMRKAAAYVRQEEWYNASSVWQELTENENPHLASKASFNMALASEMLGQPDLAWEWIKDLDLLFWDVYVKNYKKELQNRIKIQKILDRQFKVN